MVKCGQKRGIETKSKERSIVLIFTLELGGHVALEK